MQIRWMITGLGVKDGGCMNNVNNDVSVLRHEANQKREIPSFRVGRRRPSFRGPI